MAFVAGKGAAVYANGYNLSSYLNEISAPGSAEAYDVTTFQKDSRVYVGGLKDASISAAGYFSEDINGTADHIDDVFSAALDNTGDDTFLLYPPGDVLGNVGRAYGGISTKYDIDSPVDGIVTVSLEGSSNDKGSLGVKSHKALASIASGTTNGTSIDNAASSSAGGHACLQVTAQAATSLVVKVQDSADNSTWADLITFTTVTAAPAAEIKEVTGTVDRYTRFTAEATGGTATIAVGFGRK